MTVLPRMTISPIVLPSAGTSATSSSTTRTPSAVTMPTPWRACSAALVDGQVSPVRLELAEGDRAVGLGQPVDVHHREPHALHLSDRRGAGRCAGGRYALNTMC